MTLDNGLSVANDWDNDGRLASRRLYQTSGGTNLSYLSYAYDANDNIGTIRDGRVAMTSGTGTRRFVYDADGRVMGEYGVSAADVHAEYIWALPEVANDNSETIVPLFNRRLTLSVDDCFAIAAIIMGVDQGGQVRVPGPIIEQRQIPIAEALRAQVHWSLVSNTALVRDLRNAISAAFSRR